jgi:hypothetical protein
MVRAEPRRGPHPRPMLVTPPTIGNLFRTFGSRFVEPVDDLGVTSPLIDETTKGNTTNSGFDS